VNLRLVDRHSHLDFPENFFGGGVSAVGREVSMSGFERLERLSLSRRTRRRAGRQRTGNYRLGGRTKEMIEVWRLIKSLR